jgi:hypothetical protein
MIFEPPALVSPRHRNFLRARKGAGQVDVADASSMREPSLSEAAYAHEGDVEERGLLKLPLDSAAPSQPDVLDIDSLSNGELETESDIFGEVPSAMYEQATISSPRYLISPPVSPWHIKRAPSNTKVEGDTGDGQATRGKTDVVAR